MNSAPAGGGLAIRNLKFVQDDFSLETDLTIPRGSLACLLGPSGCGKTTLLRLIGGFLSPERGEISLNGRDLSFLAPHRRGLGIVFQDYALFPHLSVLENVLYGITRGKTGRLFPPSREEDRRARDFLALVKMEGYENRKIPSLSGGEQQRVALARALAPEPELLLLDEPLSALDVSLRKSLRREIRRIQQTLGVTTLYITHDQEEALALGDRLFLMDRGRIIQGGTPEEVYRSPKNLFAAGFLGTANFLPAPDSRVLFFRPEDCVVCPADEGPHESCPQEGSPQADFLYFSGKVTHSEYLGPRRNVYLDVNGTPVTLSLPAGQGGTYQADTAVREGRKTMFKVPLAACGYFPAPDTEPPQKPPSPPSPPAPATTP